MSYNVTETDTFTSAVPTPEVNDTNYPTVIPQMATALANRTNHLNKTLKGTTSQIEAFTANGQDAALADLTLPASGRADLLRNLGIALHKQIRWVRERVAGAGATAHTLTWVPAITGGAPEGGAYWDVVTPAPSGAYIPNVVQVTATQRMVALTMPPVTPGLIIGTITARVSSAVSHGGSLPAIMPSLGLYQFTTAASFATVATQVDTSASAAAYEAEHTIALTASTPVVAGTTYAIMMQGEASTNAQDASFRIYSLSMTLWYV
jgi:hypothetical protein